MQNTVVGGVSALCWLPGGFDVLVGAQAGGSAGPGPAGAGELVRFGGFRMGLSANPCRPEASALTLLGPSSLLLWAGAGDTSRAGAGIDESGGGWERLRVPPKYLAHTWPVRHSAVSDTGDWVACAGSKGAAICARRRVGKWRMFGNVNQEAMVAARSLAWYGEHVLCIASEGRLDTRRLGDKQPESTEYLLPDSSQSSSTNGNGNGTGNSNSNSFSYSLLFYPRSHLAHASLLHVHRLTTPRKLSVCMLVSVCVRVIASARVRVKVRTCVCGSVGVCGRLSVCVCLPPPARTR